MLASASHTGHASGLVLIVLLVALALFAGGCQSAPHQSHSGAADAATFGDDVAFMRAHTDLIVLSDSTGDARIAVAPEYQAKVMTSTAAGDKGLSYGWINRELIASGEPMAHINPFGGEDRFWLGPEGGQYSIFFAPGSDFVFEDWQTPAPIDWGAWEIIRQTPRSVTFNKRARIQNYSGFTFDIDIVRIIELLTGTQAEQYLGMEVPGDVDLVAYQSDNRVINKGSEAWTRETGLLSIWILGMFNPSPQTTVIVPFKPADVPQDQIVNDAYFGKVPTDRLVVRPQQGVLFFSGDGDYRSKVGVAPQYALPVLGSYDAANQVLTIVQFNLPEDAAAADYVNSMWEWQEKPFAGDVVNSYNDGPLDDGSQLGPFYELETSSPALALGPGEVGWHVSRTYHLRGPADSLDPIAQRLFGVPLADITTALDVSAE